MSNSNSWPDPDSQLAGHGRNDVRGVYLIDPTTDKAYAASGGSGGAITNDGTFARETGGNLAQIATNTTGGATAANQTSGNTNTSNTATGVGGIADSAANNSTSSWSIIALLKGLYALLTTLAGSVSSTKMQSQIVDSAGTNKLGIDVNGAASLQDVIRTLTVSGKCFSAIYNTNTGAAHFVAGGFYNPGTKNVLIYRMRASTATACPVIVAKNTTDFALGSSVTAYNKNFPSGTSTTCTISGSANATTGGTNIDEASCSAAPTELLQNNACIYLPSGSTEAVAVFISQIAAGFGSVLFEWMEF